MSTPKSVSFPIFSFDEEIIDPFDDFYFDATSQIDKIKQYSYRQLLQDTEIVHFLHHLADQNSMFATDIVREIARLVDKLSNVMTHHACLHFKEEPILKGLERLVLVFDLNVEKAVNSSNSLPSGANSE